MQFGERIAQERRGPETMVEERIVKTLSTKAAPAAKRQVLLRLVHAGVQPEPAVTDPVSFGVQDLKGNVHPGNGRSDHGLQFDVPVEVAGTSGRDDPVFSGPFCQGPRTGRFLYMSWKREGNPPAPWAWRIKIPLSEITWAMVEKAGKPGWCILADVNDRRPHKVAPIAWNLAKRA